MIQSASYETKPNQTHTIILVAEDFVHPNHKRNNATEANLFGKDIEMNSTQFLQLTQGSNSQTLSTLQLLSLLAIHALTCYNAKSNIYAGIQIVSINGHSTVLQLEYPRKQYLATYFDNLMFNSDQLTEKSKDQLNPTLNVFFCFCF